IVRPGVRVVVADAGCHKHLTTIDRNGDRVSERHPGAREHYRHRDRVENRAVQDEPPVVDHRPVAGPQISFLISEAYSCGSAENTEPHFLCVADDYRERAGQPGSTLFGCICPASAPSRHHLSQLTACLLSAASFVVGDMHPTSTGPSSRRSSFPKRSVPGGAITFFVHTRQDPLARASSVTSVVHALGVDIAR